MKRFLHFKSNHLFLTLVAAFTLIYCHEPAEFTTDNEITPRTTYYSIGDAIDYLNDSLNIWYCRPGDQYGSTLVFIDTFDVDVNGLNQISESDLEDLAVDIAETAGDHFYPRGASSKAPFMFEVRIAGTVSGGSVPIQSWFIMEEGSPASESDEYPYSDSWPYGHGSTNGCPTTPTGDDAPDLFRRDLRDNITYGGKNGKGSFAYHRLHTICFSSGSDMCDSWEIPYLYADAFEQDLDNPNDPTNYDNYYESPLFFSTSAYSNHHICLSASEMNFHYSAMKDIAEDELVDLGDKEIVQVEVGYNELFFTYTTYINSMQVYYADIIETEEPDKELPSTCCP